MPKKLNTNEFRQQLSIEHPELELLSEYNGNKNYVTVRCKIHNYTFKTKPNWLHKGVGCQKCYDDRRGVTRRKTLDKFIQEALLVHHTKNYDYSKVEYINSHTKVCIICPKHGEFWQTPSKHLNGQGCPKCANKNVTTEEWIEKVKKIHNDFYDYSKVEYVNNHTKVCIICPKHGEFWQTPDKHLNGEACPNCKSSKLEKSIRTFLTENGEEFTQQKQFIWLGKQKLDFFIPKYNIAIECQGEQHFKKIKFFGGESGFKKILIRDITKYNLCKENDIKILYIIDKKMIPLTNKKIFLGIYNNNVISIKDIDRLKNILNS